MVGSRHRVSGLNGDTSFVGLASIFFLLLLGESGIWLREQQPSVDITLQIQQIGYTIFEQC